MCSATVAATPSFRFILTSLACWILSSQTAKTYLIQTSFVSVISIEYFVMQTEVECVCKALLIHFNNSFVLAKC